MPFIPSERCEAFLRHWESLRGGEKIPTLKDFLTRPNPAIQPNIMITDFVSPTEIPIRLFGTALVTLTRSDQTKRDFVDAFATPSLIDQFAKIAEVLGSVPCGASTTLAGITARGHDVRLEMTSLPAQPYPNGPRCILSFVECPMVLGIDDFVYKTGESLDAVWIDLGAGVPDFALTTGPEKDRQDCSSRPDFFTEFSDHWFSLRGDQDVTKLSDFLNRPHPTLQPHVTIMDVESPARITFRLVGTSENELYGADVTGRTLNDVMPPEMVKEATDPILKMISVPCGRELISSVMSETKVLRKVRHIGFPLKHKDGVVRSVIWFSQPLEILRPKPFDKAGVIDLNEHGWIDIGFGVP